MGRGIEMCDLYLQMV